MRKDEQLRKKKLVLQDKSQKLQDFVFYKR